MPGDCGNVLMQTWGKRALREHALCVVCAECVVVDGCSVHVVGSTALLSENLQPPHMKLFRFCTWLQETCWSC